MSRSPSPTPPAPSRAPSIILAVVIVVVLVNEAVQYVTNVFTRLVNHPPLWLWVALAVAVFPVVRFVVIALARWGGVFNPAFYRHTIIVPWRPFVRSWLAFKHWAERFFGGRRPSSGWSGYFGTFCYMFKPGDIFLGRARAGGFPSQQPIGIDAERHIAIISGAGAGKTVHCISMAALHMAAGGSVFCVDPKGQIAKVLAPVSPNAVVLDPYEIVPDVRRAHWDAMKELEAFVQRHGNDAAVRFTAIMAEALIAVGANEQQKHFPESARALLEGIILHVHTTEPPEKRTLTRVRELLCNGYAAAAPDGFQFLLEEMAQNTAFGGLIAARANALLQSADREMGSVLSTARVQTAWLDYPEIRAISDRSDFKLEELKTGTKQLFVSAPATDIAGPLSAWFRLLSVLTTYTFESIPGRLKVPCLCLIDEFPNLGYLRSIEVAAPLLRSFGVRLCVIAQDLGQLKATYPSTWEGFLGNAEAVLWLGTNHHETALYIERILGKCTYEEVLDPGDPKTNRPRRTQRVERPLLYADEIKRYLGRGYMIVTRFGKSPMRLRPAPYFTELPISLYRADGDFKETLLRRSMRGFVKRWQFNAPPSANAPTLNFDLALSMFGLAKPYQATEVESRYQLLQMNARQSPQYAQVVDAARTILLAGVAP